MSYNSVFIDSLIRIKNAQLAMFRKVTLRFSGLTLASLSVLRDLGYVEDYEVISLKNWKSIVVHLKYYSLVPVIKDIKIFSKPGKRVFIAADKIPKFYSGMGSVILTTNKGVLSGEDARKLNVGGELLCGIF